jgi:hypothetical protein
VPREPERVAGPVEALVVLFDGEAPFAQPGHQGGDEPAALERVVADLRPLLLGRFSRFVQNVRVHGELAHVVEESGPAEPVPVGRW